jgi:REP element-mobilizing transposase RayT
MVIAHHLIITAYGWWLPNDPRGSTSHCVVNDVLKDLGELHFGRKRIQPAGREIRAFYRQAEELLDHDLLTFDNPAVQIIASAFGKCIEENHYTCYGGVVMFDHAHLCLRKHKHRAEEMIEQFQDYSARALRAVKCRAGTHPVWAEGGWKVFLDHPEDVHRTIKYIEQNPIKMHRPIQRWPWITSYNNWPFHRRLRFSSPRA